MEQRNDPRHLDFLDRLRGVAILAVFLFHCHGLAYDWDFNFSHAITLAQKILFLFNLGGLGVALFFVISGFCIHLSHQRAQRKDFTSFFTRRFFRIYPPYFVALCIFSFIGPWRIVHLHDEFSLVQFFSHLFLVHNFGNRTCYEINGAFWSIAIEVQLYLLYPLLLFLARTFTWTKALWITLALEVGVRGWVSFYAAIGQAQPIGLITGSPLGYWFSWSIGAATAEAYLKGRRLPFSRFPIWLFLILLFSLAACPQLASFGFLLGALVFVCVISRFLSKQSSVSTAPTSWAGRHLRFAGIVSYSVYLLHLPLLSQLAGRLDHSRFQSQPFIVFLILAASWIPILLISWCFYRALELPGNALGKWVVEKRLVTLPIGRTSEA